MNDLSFNTGFSETPIIPIIVGESEKAKRMSNSLFDEGVFALPIVFPMVARDQARLRLIMNAALTKDDLDEAIAAFEKVGKELKVI